MARSSSWRRAQRARIIARRLDRVRNWWQLDGSGLHANPLYRWYQPDPWPQADRIGTFAKWNPLVCCPFCQHDVFTRRPRWRWDRLVPESTPHVGEARRQPASTRRWWEDRDADGPS